MIAYKLKTLGYTPPEWVESEKVLYELVDTRDQFEEMMSDISKQQVISLDLEFHKEHSYNGFIALIQVSTRDFNYVIDPFKIREEILKIFVPKVIENGDLLKVMCGCSQDVLFTQSNYQTFLISVIDVQDMYDQWKFEASEECFMVTMAPFHKHLIETGKLPTRATLNSSSEIIRNEWKKNEPVSYKKLVEGFYGTSAPTLNKVAQAADFRIRPLGKLGLYAAQDVHYLLDMFWELRNRISEEGLTEAFNKTKTKLGKSFACQKYPDSDKLLIKSKLTKPSDKELFRKLYAWRDEISRTMDENPDVIMHLNDMCTLAKMSEQPQLNLDRLAEVLSKNKCPFTSMQMRRIVAIVNNGTVVLQRMSSMECYNCHGRAHQAWQCPHPIDLTKWKLWMKRPENVLFKIKQCKRRARNWYHKTGKWPLQAPLQWLDEVIQEDALAAVALLHGTEYDEERTAEVWEEM